MKKDIPWDVSAMEEDLKSNIESTKSFQLRIDAKLVSDTAQFPGCSSRIDKTRNQIKDHCEFERQLCRIHLEIFRKENEFIQEKNKWLAENFRLYPDQDAFFSKRREWETEFTRSNLKPLYDERRAVARGNQYFWSFAILDKFVREQLTEKDEDICKFLIDIESSWLSNMKGFQLKFTFDDSNPYFQNEFLTKTWDVIGDNKSITLKAIGSEIVWKSSCPFTRRQRIKSFFSTFFDSFASIKPLSFDTETGELKGNIPRDYVIGTIFRDKIIPHATFGCVPLSSGNPYDSDLESDGDQENE